MDWMRRQDIKEESPETPTALTPDEPDECYFEEDNSIDEGMGPKCVHSFLVGKETETSEGRENSRATKGRKETA